MYLMKYLKDLNKLDLILNSSVFLTLLAFIYFWSIKQINFNHFYVIILPLTLLFFKKKIFIFEKRFIKFFILSFSVFLLHLIIGRSFYFDFTISEIFKFLGFFSILIFCYEYKNIIISQVKYLVIFFTFIYLISIFSYLFLNLDNLNDFKIMLFNDLGCSYHSGIFKENFLFKENSHSGMVLVSCTLYLTFLVSKEKNFFLKAYFLIIIFILLLNSSTTYYLGMLVSIFLISIITYMQDYKKLTFYYGTLFLIISPTFFIDKSCSVRFSDSFRVVDTINTIKKNEKYKKESSEKYQEFYKLYEERISLESKYKNNIEQRQLELNLNESELLSLYPERYELVNKNISLNLTTQVYIRSFLIASKSIFEKPIGWGFEGYKYAYDKYLYEIPSINPTILSLNRKDASNNFVKILVEFGVFSFLLVIIFFLISFDKHIKIEYKIYFLPIIITQLIRGAGYFNGGFLISIFILLLLFFMKKTKSAL